MKKPIKVAVTGAAGNIGYAMVFRIANGDLFGADQPVELNLIDIAPAMPKLNGVKMELDDCAFPLLEKIVCTADLAEGFKDVNWAILVGSMPRKAGMERSDLLKINGGIFTGQGKAIEQYAAKDVRVFVVGNPCNTNCWIAKQSAPSIPSDRWFAMTMLDQKRAAYQLAAKAGVLSRDVSNVTIWGNHSSTQYPDAYNAKINGRPAADVINDKAWLENEFIPTVQKRGAAVIEARGASSAASAANAAISTVRALSTPTPAGEWFSVGVCSNGEYGTPKGIITSMPVRTDDGKNWYVVNDLPINEFSAARIKASNEELQAEAKSASEILGL
ncbi:MAG: malate dehydrogenase [Opitutales bacterium]|nr:malate dehydrogenase [Opitutales bacterium]